MSTYILLSNKSWGIDSYNRLSMHSNDKWYFFSDVKELTIDIVKKISPKYLFFLHWSHLIPNEIYSNYECVIFHMTDLPFGRGGSPLQNLIVREIYDTKLSAIKCVKDVDAGPIYLKCPLSLHGTAKEIFIRASKLSEEMMEHIIKNEPDPINQKGEVVVFKRRKPEHGDISSLESITKIYDYIRMLDAEGYPSAFLKSGNLKLEFSNATLENGFVHAEVFIKLKELKDGT